MGGLGLRSATFHASAAFIASSLDSRSLITELVPTIEPSELSLVEALNNYSNILQLEEPLTEDQVSGHLMKELSLKVDFQHHKNLLDSLNEVRDKARMASLGLSHAGDWLHVVPSPSLGLHLRAAEFRTAVLYRLGMPIFQVEGACVACGQPSDRYGDHAIACGSQGERIARHNHLRDALYHTAISASLSPTKEDRALLPGVDHRPADVLIPNWAGGLHAALDVTVINPLQIQTLERAATDPGYALGLRYQQKWAKYGDLCRSEGIKFCPLPVETLGGWHEDAVMLIRKLD